jgi:hypothetical protein
MRVDIHTIRLQEATRVSSNLSARSTAKDDGAPTAATKGIPAMTAF